MIVLKNAILLGYDEHRYGNTYRLRAKHVSKDFNPGDFISIQMYPAGDDMLLAIFEKKDRHYSGDHVVDRQGRLNFCPPKGCIDTRKGKERKPNYGKLVAGSFF